PSSDAVAKVRPSGAKWATTTLAGPVTIVATNRLELEAQTRTVFVATVRSDSLSGLNSAQRTAASCPRNRAIKRPVAASHNAAERSAEPVTPYRLSPLKLAHLTSSLCPERTRNDLTDSLYQMRAVRSREAVTIQRPSGLYSAERISSA